MLSVDGTSFTAWSSHPTFEAYASPDADREVLRAHIRSVLARIPGRRPPVAVKTN